MRTRSAATAAALALLVLSGCSGPAVTTAESPQPPASAPSASTTARPVGFDETYTFSDGVAVKVSKIKQAKLGPFPVTEDPSAKEGDPYIITTITLTNNTPAQVELLPLVVVRFGPDSRQAARADVGEYADQLNLEPGIGRLLLRQYRAHRVPHRSHARGHLVFGPSPHRRIRRLDRLGMPNRVRRLLQRR